MMNPINLYSALLLILLVVILAGRFLLRRGGSWKGMMLFLTIALGIIAIWFSMRPVQTPHQASAELRNQIGTGIPVLLEFQSPY